ncbi:MAG: Gfo/Idh/MocA family oxidoreductase [Spirochaetaceae bacterium]|nr:Gfo/Idh/MocA family oxidoreductase [Spirochaetaceae bacterium]
MKKLTAILLGAGHRGADAYAAYALSFPNELEFVAVAEPRQDRREEFCRLHNISAERSFGHWQQLLDQPKLADCAFICTQDRMHFEPLLRAVALGYQILVEKPVTPDKEELLKIRELARSYHGVISVAHVLRYSSFFSKIKELLEQGAIGNLVNIQHMESVGWWHMAHSFVRGNWRNSEESCPMILAKCCHDFDILLWLVGKPCRAVSSFGSLKVFKAENAPKGSPGHCLDGCVHRDSCPFYAPRFYLENPQAPSGNFRRVVAIEDTDEALLEALATGPYGRCVYRCDNDVVDHQVVNMVFDGDVTASLTMSAFTEHCQRTINLQGTRGQITGCMEDNRVVLTDFTSGNVTEFKLRVPPTGHSGSDTLMMRTFVELVSQRLHSGSHEIPAAANSKNRSDAVQTVESHLMALAAEESRLQGGVLVSMDRFCTFQEGG